VDDELTVGDIDSFSFFARAGDSVTIETSRLDNSSITREYSLFAPDGSRILTTTQSVQTRTIQTTGLHTILLREWSANGVQSGEYRIAFSTTGSGGGVVEPTVEATLVSSCLAGNGRVDLNIVNTSTPSSVYRYEFQGRSPRQFTVPFEQRTRQALTGRPPGLYNAVVTRDGIEILNETIAIDCSDPVPNVSSPEASVLVSCPGGNGFAFFQMVNPTAASRPYIIEFEGLRNRSTTAAPFGQTIRGVSGRPDGFYDYRVRTGSTIVKSGTLEVDCD